MEGLMSVQKQLLEKQMTDMQKSFKEYKQKVEKIGFEITELNKKLINNNMAIAARIGELERRIHD